MTSPISPTSGGGPLLPLNSTPPPNLTQEELDTLSSLDFALRSGLPESDRISINDFYDSVVNTLLELIQNLREADLQGNRNILLTAVDQSNEVLAALTKQSTLVQSQQTKMTDLISEAQALNDQKDVIDSARDDYNAAVTEYLDYLGTGLPASAPADLAAARDALNQAITHYNDLVSNYQGTIDAIDAARTDAGVPPIEQTNALPIVKPIPDSELIDFDPTAVSPDKPAPVLIPPIDLNPPMAVFDPSFGAFDGGLTIDDDYQTAYNNFINIRTELNQLIITINATEDPNVALNLRIAYNLLVTQYNSALSTLSTERDNLNAKMPSGGPLIPDPMIDPADPLPLTGTISPYPLSTFDDPVQQSDWTLFFEQAKDNYNQALSDYLSARDALNNVINTINNAYNDPGFDFSTDYDGLKTTYNNALADYNTALGNLLDERDKWNSFVSTYDDGADTILFNQDAPEDPLPDNPGGIPPPRSDVSVLGIDTANFQYTIYSSDFETVGTTDIVNKVIQTNTDLHQTIDLALQNKTLLSLIFLARGSPTSEIYEPSSTASGSAGTLASPASGSLAGLVLGLGSPRVTEAISEVNVAEAFESLFKAVDAAPPKTLASNIQTVSIYGGINAALASTRFALKIAADFLKILSPESFPANLAASLGLSQALAAISNNGGFSEIVRSSLSKVGSIAGLPNNNREAVLSTIGNLSAFTLVFAAAQDLGNVASSSPELALGTLALNLAFGVSGTQLSLREAVHSISNQTGGEQTPSGQQDLTKAFDDILLGGGLPAGLSKALAIKLSSKLFYVDNPTAFLREEAPKELVGSLANITTFAALLPQRSQLQNLLGLTQGQAAKEAIINRFKRRGFSENAAAQFINIANKNQSVLRTVAQLQSQIGPQATLAGFSALRDLQIASSLGQKLKGELSQSDAQSLIKEALTSINSLENTQDRIIKEFVKEDNRKAVQKAAELAQSLYKEREKPSLLLEEMLNPTKAMLHAASSLMGEGLLPQSTLPGLRTYPESGHSQELDFRV